MASFVLDKVGTFPEGTSVGAYLARAIPAGHSSAPPATAIDTQTMTNGTLTFTGLTEDTSYMAGGSVNGSWRYLNFTVDNEPPAQANDALYTGTVIFRGNVELPAGTVTPDTLSASVTGDYEHAFGTYKPTILGQRYGGVVDTLAAGHYVFLTNALILSTADGAPYAFTWIDPANYAAGDRDVRFRVVASAFVNEAAPDRTMVVSLRTLNGVAGGADALTGTVSAALTDSTVSFASPSATSRNHSESADFELSAAAWCGLAVELQGGAITADSEVGFTVALEVRQI